MLCLLLLFTIMSVVVDNWSNSIALCKHVLKELTDKVNVLKSSLDYFNESHSQSLQLKKIEEFYNSFQEAYDLYFFLYLGHFLRTEHYHKQKNEIITDKTFLKGLAPYEVFQYEKGKLNKIYNEGTKYWKHCISCLLLAL